MPYELNVHAKTDASSSSIVLTFINTGQATAVFHVRSANPADLVRTYTVEPGKRLADSWNAAPSYNLSVHGPNGFLRTFNGSIGSGAAVLGVRSSYETEGAGSVAWRITNLASGPAEVSVLDAYTGNTVAGSLHHRDTSEGELDLGKFHGWYDLIVTVAGDPTFRYQLAGHVETGKESFSDPAMGGLVTLKD